MPARFPSRVADQGRDTFVVPGIMTFMYAPSIGVAFSTDSAAINVAAKNIYAYVRFANSGARNYDAPNLMTYLLALDSAYQIYACGVRLYAALIQANASN